MGKIIHCAIQREPEIATAISEQADELARLLVLSVELAMARLQQAEKDCLARLNQYVPTDRPLTIDEAAAYLRMKSRTLDDNTRPGREPLVPFILLAGRKLFRKDSLDLYLARHEVGKKGVKL